MPCYDSGQGSPSAAASDAEAHAKRVEALLCGLTTVLEKSGVLDAMLKLFDEKEAGQTVADFKVWYARHKADDEKRREHEAWLKTEAGQAETERQRKIQDAFSAKWREQMGGAITGGWGWRNPIP